MLYHTFRVRGRLACSLSPLALLAAFPLHAQDATSTEAAADDLHDRRADSDGEIVVTSSGLREMDLLAGKSVLATEELQASMQGQVGDVLAKLPGVSASGFAPGASRPILRGFSGERVKVMVDGLGALDASNTSVDHAVSIDPLTAESIEVLRGPAVLIYGSQAIGGAVNVIDKRIPRRLPGDHAHLDAMLRADTVADLREAGASLDVPLGGGFVAHLDGSWRDSDDLRVPGYLVAPELRADLLADADEEEAEGELEEAAELREAADARGRVPGTFTRTFSANGGLAFFREGGSIGAAVGIYDSLYGVPLRPGTGHHHEEGEGEPEAEEEGGEESVSIDLRQLRADLRADVDLGGGFLDRLTLRAGFSDYTHTELEGDEVGTVFDVTGVEARLELAQAERGEWRGAWGAQYFFRDFAAVGAEAYIAPNTTEQLAAFVLQEVGIGKFQLEGALRYEHQVVESVPLGIERRFGAVSGGLGLAWQATDDFRTGVSLTRVSRAPSAEELFANGPHIATQAFEIGDPDLSREKAWGVEVYGRGRIGAAELSLSAYRNWFDDYIYLAETGEEEDDLPVFVYLQSDATYTGIEGELRLPLASSGGWRFGTDLRGEYVRATLADGSPVPRIPPLSLLGALTAESARIDLRGEVEWTAAQNRIAASETATDGFAMVNAELAWRPFADRDGIALVLKADNIFDVTGRRHASFTKDYVPLPGRNFSASLRASF